MTTLEKIQTTEAFLTDKDNYHPHEDEDEETLENRRSLYNLISSLNRFLKNQLAVEQGASEPQPFDEEQRGILLNWALNYLAIQRNNNGDETCLMVRYFRNSLEKMQQTQEQHELEDFLPPRMERSMNVSSPFYS